MPGPDRRTLILGGLKCSIPGFLGLESLASHDFSYSSRVFFFGGGGGGRGGGDIQINL